MIAIPHKFLRGLLLRSVTFIIIFATATLVRAGENANVIAASKLCTRTEQEFIPNKDRDTEFYVYTITGLSLSALNIISCIFVFVRTYTKWAARNYDSLPMTLRLPFYTAISDAIIGVFLCVNIGFTAIHTHPWDEPGCSIIGLFANMFTLFNRCLFVAISFTTYLRVCRRITVGLGRFDWRLVTFVVLTSIGLSVLPYWGRNYGTQRYLCYIASKNIWVFYAIFAHIIVEIVVALFCYLNIIFVLNRTGKNVHKGRYPSRSQKETAIEVNVTRKIVSYVLVYLLQWVPTLVFVIAHLIGAVNAPWTYTISVIGANFGGIGTAINYVNNEGWTRLHNDTSISSTSTGTKCNTDSYINTSELRFSRQDESHGDYRANTMTQGILVTSESEIRESYLGSSVGSEIREIYMA